MAENTGTPIDSLAIEIESNATGAVDGIKQLSNTLATLKNALKGGIGLKAVATQMSAVNDAAGKLDSTGVSNIGKLAENLNKLKDCGKLKLSSSVSNQLSKLGTVTKELTGVDFSQIGKLGDALQSINAVSDMKLSSSIANQLGKIGEAAQTLNNVDFSGVERLGTALKPLADMSDGNLATLLGQLKQLKSASKISKSNSGLDTGTWSKNIPIIKQLTSAFQKLKVSVKNAAKSATTFSWTELVSKFTVIKGVIQTISNVLASAVNSANEYVEAFNLFNVSLGEYAQSAQEYAEMAADAVGVDPAEWLKQQGVFNTIIEGFGVASDRAIVMSQNLTQLGYDLSSFFNIGTEEAFQKLESGIAGELEPLRRLGYDLSVARLEQERLNLGIETSVNDMTQAQKSQLRYYAILTQVTDAQGDMARTLSSPANQLRVLKAQVEQCARAFGNIFIPALNAVLPYVIAFVKVVRMAAQEIANFFGYELPEVDYSSSISNSSAAMDDLTDSTNKATQAAKKLKNATIGIDELNIISPNDDSSSGSGSGSGGGSDLDFELPTYDFLEGLTENRVNQIAESMMNALRNAFETGDWQSLGEFIGGKINQAMDAIPWSDIGSAIGYGINGLIQTIYYTLDTVDWNKLGTHFGELVNSALSEINFDTAGRLLTKSFTILPDIIIGFLQELDWSLVGHSFSDFVMGALQEGIEWLDKYDWGELGNNLAQDIDNLFSSIEWNGIANRAFALLGKAIKATWNFSDGFWDTIFSDSSSKSGIDAWVEKNITQPFGDAIGSELETSLAKITSMVSLSALAIGVILAFSGANIPLGIGLMARGAVGLATTVTFADGEITGQVSKSLSQLTTKVGTFSLALGAILALTGVATPLGVGLMAAGAVGLGTSVVLNWSSLSKSVSQGLSNIQTAVEQGKKNLSKVWDNCKQDASSFASTLGTKMTEAKNNVSKFASEKWASLKTNFANAVDKVVKEAGTFKTNLSTKMTEAKKVISSWASEKWTNLKTNFKSGADAVVTAAGNFKTNLSNNLSKAKTVVEDWAKNVKKWFTNNVKGSDFSTIALDLITSFKTTITNRFGDVQSAITSFASKIVEWFKNIASGETFKKIAQDVISGFKNGILEKLGLKKVEEATETAANTAVNSAKTTLGVHSPSTVFKEIGEYLILGFVNGIAGGETDVKTAVQDVMEGAANAAQAGREDIIAEWDGTWESLKEITRSKEPQVTTLIRDGFDDCISSVNDFSSSISGIGNSISDLGDKLGIEWLSDVGSFVSGVGDAISAATEFAENIKTAYNSVKEFYENFKTLQSVVTQVLDSTNGEATSWGGTFINTLATGLKNSKSVLSGALETVKSWFSGAFGSGSTLLSNAVSWGKSIVQSLANGMSGNKSLISSACSVLANAVKTAFNGASGVWNDVVNGLSTALSGKSFSLNLSTIFSSSSDSGWDSGITGWLATIYDAYFDGGSNFFSLIWTVVKGIAAKIGAEAVGTVVSKGGKVVSGIVSGASTGAAIGSNFGVVGTIVGGFIGGFIGGIGGLFSAGGGIFPDNFGKPTLFANGGYANHGSMFVAGESGAELVGHINGQTEVMNRFQIASVMQSSVSEAMRPVIEQLATCANAVIRSNAAVANAVANGISVPTYTPSPSLAQNVYNSSVTTEENDDNVMEALRVFYSEYLEPKLNEIAADTKRQADKEEITTVQIGNRVINDAVTTQKKANGYVFAT